MVNSLKTALAWLVKELARSILLPVSRWLAGVLALLFPPVIVWIFQGGIGFLTTSHPIPGWAISLVSSFVLVLLFFLMRQLVRHRKKRPGREETFQWRGLEWILRPDFWAVYQTLPVSDIAPGFLKDCIGGPFCTRCKRDPSIVVESIAYCIDRCRHCPTQFDFKDLAEESGNNLIPIDFLKKRVYVEAQGAARNNEI